METPQIRLLLADDDQDDCLIFQEALEELPWSVQLTTVSNGEQLMYFLEKEGEKLPTVLFLDLNMPRKNGLECLHEIGRHENLKSLPVVVYSTSLDTEVVNQLYKNGARYYVRKPTEFSQLKRVIHQALSLVTQTAAALPDREKFVLQP